MDENVDESLVAKMEAISLPTSRMSTEDFRPNTRCWAGSRRFFCLCAAAVFLVLPARGQDSVNPLPQSAANKLEEGPEHRFVEPIMTEETMPNPVGDWDLRISTEYRRRDDVTTAALPRIQFFGGLFPRVGIEIGVPLAYHEGDDKALGIGDVEITLKRLMAGDGLATTAVVLGLETGLPLGSVADDLGEGAYELAPFVALLRDFGSYSLQGNTGWSTQMAKRDGENESQWFYNIALITSVSKSQLHLIGELNGGWSDADGSSPQSAALGIKYPVSDGGFLALGIPFGLNSDADDWGIVIQFQIEI